MPSYRTPHPLFWPRQNGQTGPSWELIVNKLPVILWPPNEIWCVPPSNTLTGAHRKTLVEKGTTSVCAEVLGGFRMWGSIGAWEMFYFRPGVNYFLIRRWCVFKPANDTPEIFLDKLKAHTARSQCVWNGGKGLQFLWHRKWYARGRADRHEPKPMRNWMTLQGRTWNVAFYRCTVKYYGDSNKTVFNP